MESNESDAELAFYSAMSLLGLVDYSLDFAYKKYASMRARVEVHGKTIEARVSEGFRAAPQDAVMGLALNLLERVFHKNANAEYYARAYKSFIKRQSTAELDKSMRRKRTRTMNPAGKVYDLTEILANVKANYPPVFGDTTVVGIGWSQRLGRRVLGIHDEAHNIIAINSRLDDERVPRFFMEYLVYHELLHAKHGAKYERGASMQRRVHTKEFRDDEKRFAYLAEAEHWIKTRWPPR
ncbi:hypothetical protein AUJ14_00020 [Candidatus Micrarchaeota archaeon CG1_02_55_22]|nr:MAG: hypothetical protein AUJ14_00020 [Candidatus Micrarchaeota archaeon CG1_02_55_22]